MNLMSEKQIKRRPFELLLDQEKIAQRIAELGDEITRDYKDKKPLLIGVLKGCVVFMSDLIREINLPIEMDFVSATSYREGTKQNKEIFLNGSLSIPIKGRDVLIVEGIVDSGRTINSIQTELKKLEPTSIAIVTLIDKPASHRWKLDIKYKGFSIGNEFVIGYGLDNAQNYRNLPFIGKMVEE